MPRMRRPRKTRTHRRWDRHASTIQRAWRQRRRRRQGGLVARTALANRRAIRRVKSEIEVKEANGNPSVVGDQFESGQGNLSEVIVDQLGTMTTMAPPIPDTFACNLISLNGGVGADEMLGKQITMKSLAVKCFVESDSRSARTTYHLYLIHDTSATEAPLNLNGDIIKMPALGAPPAPYGLALGFTNKSNVGKGKRVRILDHKVVHLSCVAHLINENQVLPIVTAAAPPPPAVPHYGNTTRAQYMDVGCNNNTTNGSSAAEVTLFSKAPFKFEFADNGAAQLPVNQTIYLYAYQYGLGGYATGSQPQARLFYRANLRFTDL